MRKTLSALVLVLSTLPMQAQDSSKPDPTQLYALLDGRTIVKTDPLSVAVGKLNLQVERLLVSGSVPSWGSILPLWVLQERSQEPSTTNALCSATLSSFRPSNRDI